MLPTPPPRDADGNVVPHNHADILDADGIIRRVTMQHVVEDPKAVGGRKLSSILFNPSSGLNGGLSVDLRRPIEEDGLAPQAFVTTEEFVGSVIMIAQVFRSKALQVGYDPLPTNSYHGEVWGNFTGGCKRQLLKLADWFVPVNGVSHPSGYP